MVEPVETSQLLPCRTTSPDATGILVRLRARRRFAHELRAQHSSASGCRRADAGIPGPPERRGGETNWNKPLVDGDGDGDGDLVVGSVGVVLAATEPHKQSGYGFAMGSNMARRWFARVALAAVIIFTTIGLSANSASAHNSVIGYSPAEGSVVTEQPGVIAVTTSEALLDLGGVGASSAMVVTGPEGAAKPLYFGDGCATFLGPTAEMAAQLGQRGEYTVIWQVVSTDGHPVSGEYSFTWQPAEGEQLAEGSRDVPNCGGAGSVATDKPPTDVAGPGASAPTGAVLANVLWIGGALGAVLLVVVGTLLVVTRRKPRIPPETQPHTDLTPPTPPAL